MAVRRDEQVAGLDVAMHNALGVRGGQGAGDLGGVGHELAIGRGVPSSTCFSVRPSSSSSAMNDWPSCWPIS